MDIAKDFQDWIKTGYCKSCRQWDVLTKRGICFECLELTLPQVIKKINDNENKVKDNGPRRIETVERMV